MRRTNVVSDAARPQIRRGRDGATNRRERDVVKLALEGLTAREIGSHLFIGQRTVESHLAHAYRKLGVPSKLELVRRPPVLD